MASSCTVCGNRVHGADELVLARGRRRVVHCSQTCLRKTLREQRLARAARRRRTAVSLSLIVLALAGGLTLRRHRAPRPNSISYSWTDTKWETAPPPQPETFGPRWPPTDEDWMFAFDRVSWTYPLPGPVRRAPAADDWMVGPEDRKSTRLNSSH